MIALIIILELVNLAIFWFLYDEIKTVEKENSFLWRKLSIKRMGKHKLPKSKINNLEHIEL